MSLRLASRPRFVSLIVVLISVALSGVSQTCSAIDVPGAQELLAKELDPLARRIYEFLKKEQESALRIADFTFVNNQLDCTNSNLVKLALADALREQKVTIKRQANATLSGRIEFIAKETHDDYGALLVNFHLKIINGPEEELRPPFEIKNDVVKPVLLGSNWISRNSPRAVDRVAQVTDDATRRANADKPPRIPPVESETRVRLGDYAVELAVRPRGVGSFEPRAVKFGDGDDLNKSTPFVPIAEDEEYEVRIYNSNGRFDGAAELLIDGVNSLYFWNVEKAFAPTARVQHWLVPRSSSVRIAGWQRNTRTAERFIVKKFSESVAAELNLQNTDEKIGTITVVVYSAWKQGEAGDLSASGRGDTFENQVEPEVRHFGPMKAVITIRYATSD